MLVVRLPASKLARPSVTRHYFMALLAQASSHRENVQPAVNVTTLGALQENVASHGETDVYDHRAFHFF